MKRIWREEGVSPVIATILMVAITVVLAAVLYVMVMGFGGTGARPVVGFQAPEKISTKVWTVSLSDCNPPNALSKFKVLVKNATSVVITADALSGTYSKQYVASGNTLTVAFTDLTNDQKLGGGDYFTCTFSGTPVVGNTYTITILWSSDDKELVSKDFSI